MSRPLMASPDMFWRDVYCGGTLSGRPSCSGAVTPGTRLGGGGKDQAAQWLLPAEICDGDKNSSVKHLPTSLEENHHSGNNINIISELHNLNTAIRSLSELKYLSISTPLSSQREESHRGAYSVIMAKTLFCVYKNYNNGQDAIVCIYKLCYNGQDPTVCIYKLALTIMCVLVNIYKPVINNHMCVLVWVSFI